MPLHLLNNVHASWHSCLNRGLAAMDEAYIADLDQTNTWLPGSAQVFNAFQLPIHNVRFVLLGESPYPRQSSANGFAFWDNAVTNLWQSTGLATPINRATSLRHLIKMLLVAEGALSPNDTSQAAIAKLPKQMYHQTAAQLFQGMQQKGILLLNASLALSKRKVALEAKLWQPMLREVLTTLSTEPVKPTLILLGRIAHQIKQLPQAVCYPRICAEHPYNISFITNETILTFFKPLHLLRYEEF